MVIFNLSKLNHLLLQYLYFFPHSNTQDLHPHAFAFFFIQAHFGVVGYSLHACACVFQAAIQIAALWRAWWKSLRHRLTLPCFFPYLVISWRVSFGFVLAWIPYVHLNYIPYLFAIQSVYVIAYLCMVYISFACFLPRTIIHVWVLICGICFFCYCSINGLSRKFL